MRNALLLLILLSTGVGLSAQQNLFSTQTPHPISTLATGCPVNFDAQFSSQARMYSIGEQKKFGDSPLLDLTFSDRRKAKILGASITVHGLSASSSARYLPVNGQASQNKIQTFRVDLASESAGLARTQLRVTDMMFVRWAEITELRYADGYTWHPSALAQCRARPSGFTLVN